MYKKKVKLFYPSIIIIIKQEKNQKKATMVEQTEMIPERSEELKKEQDEKVPTTKRRRVTNKSKKDALTTTTTTTNTTTPETPTIDPTIQDNPVHPVAETPAEPSHNTVDGNNTNDATTPQEQPPVSTVSTETTTSVNGFIPDKSKAYVTKRKVATLTPEELQYRREYARYLYALHVKKMDPEQLEAARAASRLRKKRSRDSAIENLEKEQGMSIQQIRRLKRDETVQKRRELRRIEKQKERDEMRKQRSELRRASAREIPKDHPKYGDLTTFTKQDNMNYVFHKKDSDLNDDERMYKKKYMYLARRRYRANLSDEKRMLLNERRLQRKKDAAAKPKTSNATNTMAAATNQQQTGN